ncbi:MAG: Stealth CR1 domain-containing protein [Bacteroidales bacterium]|nr:Stealth CR1 domain-containing protein [Bacteroidales bacterium]
MEVDAVILWVDGNDPKHRNKISPYLKQIQGENLEFIAAPTRYNSVGEIFYCVASLFRFATFLRKIFIITDNQNPNLDCFIKKNFPDSKTKIQIIDHTEIFEGYERFLPVFNSRAIEACISRIKDLSEHFIYLNDDMFLLRKVNVEDFFLDDKIIARGQWRSIFFDSLLKYLKPRKEGIIPYGFKDSMINSARYLGHRFRYFHIEHNAHALRKSLIEQMYRSHPYLRIVNMKHKFRDNSQFNTQSFFFYYAIDNGFAIKSSDTRLLYMKPVNRGSHYVERKISLASKDSNLCFGCIGSLDLASEKDQKMIREWMCQFLNINL